MKIEHLAFNVSDPVKMAQWYQDNLEMSIARSYDVPVPTRFLADGKGGVLEIYRHPDKAIPEYRSMDPLLLHLAFQVDKVGETQKKLVAAGAKIVAAAAKSPAGDTMAMLRDPWGLALQLVNRVKPL